MTVNTKTSIYFKTVSFNCSNLLGRGFIFKFPIIILSGFLVLNLGYIELARKIWLKTNESTPNYFVLVCRINVLSTLFT